MQFVKLTIANAYIARTPEVSQTPSGTTKMKFSLPVNSKKGDVETTTWYEVTVWGKQAEALISLRDRGLFTKGSSVFVEGRFEIRPYTGRDGDTRFSNDVNADNVLLLSPPKGYQEEGSAVNFNAPPAQQEADLNDDMASVPF